MYEFPPAQEHSQEYQDFIKKCVAIDPDSRPTIDELLETDFMNRAAQNKQTWKDELEALSNTEGAIAEFPRD